MAIFGESCPACCWDIDRLTVTAEETPCRFCSKSTGDLGGARTTAEADGGPADDREASPIAGSQDEERGLVLRAQAFDEEALSALFNIYYPRMYTYGLAHLREVPAAEDFASDVILRVLDGIRRYRVREQPFSAWVFRIARNRLIDIQRRHTRYRQVPWDDKFASLNGPGQAPIKQLLDIDEIRLGLADLTEGQAQVIVLRFLQDLDVSTVARILGRSERAVKSLQFRAITALRQTIAGQGQLAGAPNAPAVIQ